MEKEKISELEEKYEKLLEGSIDLLKKLIKKIEKELDN